MIWKIKLEEWTGDNQDYLWGGLYNEDSQVLRIFVNTNTKNEKLNSVLKNLVSGTGNSDYMKMSRALIIKEILFLNLVNEVSLPEYDAEKYANEWLNIYLN